MTYEQAVEFARSLRKNQTASEYFFWCKVRNRQLAGLKFYRQYIIEFETHLTHQSYYFVDFYIHRLKLIIEIDGSIHEHQLLYDIARQQILENLGYKILRFSNEEVLYNWDSVEEKLLKEALE